MLIAASLLFVSVPSRDASAANDDINQQIVVKIENPEIYTIDTSILQLQELHSSNDPGIQLPISKKKKYKCTYDRCNKEFTQKSNLTTHIQSVHEKVKHKCDHCGAEFTQKGHLTTHINN